MNTNNVLEIQNYPEFSIIRFFGFVDAGTVENIKPVVDAKMSPDCTQMIVDLEKVDFLDSHGIGFFVSLLKKVHRKKGRLIFAGAHNQPASVLNMVGFNGSLVTYCESMQEARTMLKNEKE